MKEKQTEIGVIIGRFQLHELHQAHIDPLETVFENGKLIREQTFDEIRKIALTYTK